MGAVTAERTVVYVASTASVLAMFWRPLLRRMTAAGWRVVVLAPPGPRWANLSEPGVEHRPFAIARPLGAFASHTRTMVRLYGVYRELRPALVHHFTANPVIYGSLAARAAGVACIVNTLPGLGAVFTSQRWDAPALRTWTLAALRVSTRLGHGRTIVQNRADHALLVSRRIVPADRAVLILGSGIDLDRFRPLPEPDGEPTVLFCARMLRSKGVGDVVDAVRVLRRRGAQLRLLLVGPSDPHHRDAVPVAQLDAWCAEGIAAWLGMREDMPELYAAANLVALPSRYGEGVPSVLAEAAASGRAIVASDTPGCRAVVRHEHNGLLVPAGDVSALAAALERLLRDRALRAAMGRRGREIAVAEFSRDRVGDAIAAVYDALRGERTDRRAA
jgi:glycosyltransferase involved in cell wall biosynthesis